MEPKTKKWEKLKMKMDVLEVSANSPWSLWSQSSIISLFQFLPPRTKQLKQGPYDV